MNKAEYINKLISEWIEIYQETDKRTKKAKEISNTINGLFYMAGLVGCKNERN